jgi:hypothetical protein
MYPRNLISHQLMIRSVNFHLPFIAFMALVAVRAYQHVIRRELEVGSNLLNQDGLAGINNERSSRIPSGPSEVIIGLI